MTINLYNTLTRRKDLLKPIVPDKVGVYVCGPTVYDYAHIGNARPIIVFDLLFRLLRHEYGAENVTYVRNITDVDDKINARAAEEGVPIGEVTARTIEQFHKDIAALGVLPPTVEPRATDHIKEMKAMCETLVEKGHAYVADDHVLFDVPSMPDYGKLSNRTLDEMKAGARVEVAAYKKDPTDFVLWKPSKESEPSWPSPCGIAAAGRPGWHIECSAMSKKHLGEVFDIHGGGIDLKFPHHENEIAQSRCAHGTDVMANIWMHNGFLQVEGEKMSKSLGNFITINELLETDKFGGRRWPGEVLRLAMLMTHYKEPINWSVDRLIEAWKELSSWVHAVTESVSHPYPVDFKNIEPDPEIVFALSKDLNTPLARTRLQELAKIAEGGDITAKKCLAKSMSWLGIYRPEFHDAYEYFGVSAKGTKASGGKAPRLDLLNKYTFAYRDAQAIVLNRYRWHQTEVSDREASRAEVERHINEMHPEMLSDGVGFELNEHCCVTLVPLSADAKLDEQKIAEMIAARAAARKAKDWPEGDRIRDELGEMGVQLKDSKDPETGEIVTTWELKR